MKTKSIELKDEFNTIYDITICDDTCGNNRFNVIINLRSNEFGGRQKSVIKNVMNKHKANIIFNGINKDNIIMVYELMS